MPRYTYEKDMVRSADIILEGNVNTRIMSFSRDDFLYKGTVCKSWRKHYPVATTYTNLLRAFESASSVQEAVVSGINTIGLFDLAVVFCADLTVLQALWDMGATRCHHSTSYYAAYTGNMAAYRLLCSSEYSDECDLFEAVRGGHVDIVKYAVENMLPAAEDAAVNEKPAWHCSTYDNAFIKRCMAIANACGKQDVGETLHAYVEDKYFRPLRDRSMSAVDLALAMDRLDIVRVLRKAGGRFNGDASLCAAVNTGDAELVRYLEQEGCTPTGHVLSEYLVEMPDNIDYITYLLRRKLVYVDARALDIALTLRKNNMVDLLLSFGAPVCDSTIDRAISEWSFERARSLMASYGCRPTANAYLFLFSQGVDVEQVLWCDPEDLHLDFDDVYLEGLELIFSSQEYAPPVGFESFGDMMANRVWAIVLQNVSSEVVQWFKDRFAHEMQVDP